MRSDVKIRVAAMAVLVLAAPARAQEADIDRLRDITKDELQTRPGKQPQRFRRMKDWEMSGGKKRC